MATGAVRRVGAVRCGKATGGCAKRPRRGTGGPAWPAPSVAEVAHSGEDHRHAVLVRRGDALRVTFGSAGLDDGPHPGAGGDLHPIGEREERIRRQGGASDGMAFALRVGNGDAYAPNPAGMAGAISGGSGALR